MNNHDFGFVTLAMCCFCLYGMRVAIKEGNGSLLYLTLFAVPGFGIWTIGLFMQ